MTTKLDVHIILTGITAILTYLFGGFDSLLKVTIIFIFMDLVTGITKGFYEGNINSERSWKGLLKKSMFFVIILLATLLDKITKLNEQEMSFRALTLLFIISNEGISILENIIEMGVPVPKKLKKILEKIQSEDD